MKSGSHREARGQDWSLGQRHTLNSRETLLRGHTCVPLMPTGGPGELSGEAVAQVENGPCQDDDVVHI